MTGSLQPLVTVAVVEGDEDIRRMLGVALYRSGFAARCFSDPAEASGVAADVILRAVEFSSPAQLVSDLAALPAAVRRQTILMVTSPLPLARLAREAGVFRVVRKPFDLPYLMELISRCARAARPTRPEGGAAEEWPATDDSHLRRFHAALPGLRYELAETAATARGMFLQAEIRRTVHEIAGAFELAARAESDPRRAASFREASMAATDVVGPIPPRTRRHRDH